MIELRQALFEFTNREDENGQKKKAPKTFVKIVQRNFEKVEGRLKVIGMPKDQLVEFYNKMVADRSEEDFLRILKLRGIKPAEVAIEYLNLD